MKIAVVGLGVIGRVHAEILHDRGELYAVCDIDGSKKEIYPDAIFCNDYEAMLDELRPDAVHICTPHYLHAPMVIAALSRNIHVLCEKPLCIKEEDISAILEAERASSATLGVCFQNRFNPANCFVLDYIKDKEVLSVCGQVAWHRGADYYASGEWRGRWDTEGGGVLINQAIHTLDLTALLAGMPHQVLATVSNLSLRESIEVEDTATIVGIGAVPFTFFATNAAEHSMSVEITVKTREEEIKIMPHAVLVGDKAYSFPKTQRVLGKECYGTGHVDLIERFYDCIERGEHFPIDGAEGAKSIRIILAAYRSLGERVDVKEI